VLYPAELRALKPKFRRYVSGLASTRHAGL
jgi:hypothetical protein